VRGRCCAGDGDGMAGFSLSLLLAVVLVSGTSGDLLCLRPVRSRETWTQSRIGSIRQSHDIIASMAMDLAARLRARGWRLSPQRRVVAEVMVGDHVHLTAEEVHDLARERLPEISRATVYNTLNELVAMGEVLEVDVFDGAKRYDPNVAEQHDHLVCQGCHEIRDVPRSGRAPAIAGTARAGYRVTAVEVTFRGLCPACAGA
jgi:Fur family transcriptional regulator, stress-responsive regulator